MSVSQEREKSVVQFEVQVDTATGRVEVEVRASDGTVIEMGRREATTTEGAGDAAAA